MGWWSDLYNFNNIGLYSDVLIYNLQDKIYNKSDAEAAETTRSAKRKFSKTKTVNTEDEITTACIEKDDQVIEMETAGQATEFLSDEEQNSEGKSNKGTLLTQSTQTDSDEETEVFLNMQRNNNAMVHGAKSLAESDGRDLEDGECSRTPINRSDSEVGGGPTQLNIIDQRISTSLNKFQTYFEKKFDDMSRVMEQERQLAENQGHLQQLKIWGIPEAINNTVDMDQQSELTVYKKAIEKQRDSSSSEDLDLIDTSDETLNNTFVERELINRRHNQLDQ